MTDVDSTLPAGYKFYVKKLKQPMRPYVDGEDMSGISVSAADQKLETLAGGMIACNPIDAEDQWYVAQKFFKENYEEYIGSK